MKRVPLTSSLETNNHSWNGITRNPLVSYDTPLILSARNVSTKLAIKIGLGCHIESVA